MSLSDTLLAPFNRLSPSRALERRRRRLLAAAPPGPLRDYLAVPFADPAAPVNRTPYLAVDLETTGLNAEHDAIVSIGYVALQGNRIVLEGAGHRVVQNEAPLTERSVTIHGITDDQVAAGMPLAEALTLLLQQLAGKVMVAHHAEVEFNFLRAACRRVFGGEFLVPVVDTQWLAQRRLERRQQPWRAGELRLWRLREHYHLPRYPAHNALSDALASAELFLAQLAEQGDENKIPLKRLLRPRWAL